MHRWNHSNLCNVPRKGHSPIRTHGVNCALSWHSRTPTRTPTPTRPTRLQSYVSDTRYFLARIPARMSVSMSASWNASLIRLSLFVAMRALVSIKLTEMFIFNVIRLRRRAELRLVWSQYYRKSDQPPPWRWANLGIQNFKTPEPTVKEFAVDDYFCDISQHAKIQNDSPIGRVAAYEWNIILAWLLISFSFLYCNPKFCSHPDTKPQNKRLRGSNWFLCIQTHAALYFRKITVPSKAKDTFLWNFVPDFGLKKFGHGTPTVNECDWYK